ncbi:MAG: hypothetical protein OEL54_04250, partial [Flavobacteriaceae bacterium]|nr:hypothetical protein [Flavobacteriaceae bacterium]
MSNISLRKQVIKALLRVHDECEIDFFSNLELGEDVFSNIIEGIRVGDFAIKLGSLKNETFKNECNIMKKINLLTYYNYTINLYPFVASLNCKGLYERLEPQIIEKFDKNDELGIIVTALPKIKHVHIPKLLNKVGRSVFHSLVLQGLSLAEKLDVLNITIDNLEDSLTVAIFNEPQPIYLYLKGTLYGMKTKYFLMMRSSYKSFFRYKESTESNISNVIKMASEYDGQYTDKNLDEIKPRFDSLIRKNDEKKRKNVFGMKLNENSELFEKMFGKKYIRKEEQDDVVIYDDMIDNDNDVKNSLSFSEEEKSA